MTKKRVLLIISSIIVLMVASVAGFFGYIQLSLFEVEPIAKDALQSYINTEGVNLLARKQDNLYEGRVSLDILSDELTQRLIEEEMESDAEVVSANVDLTTLEASVNYRQGGFYVPVYHTLEYSVEEYGLNIVFYPESYGTKHINMPDFIDQGFFGSIFASPKTIEIHIDEYDTSDVFVYEKVSVQANELIGAYRLQLPNLSSMVNIIKRDVTPAQELVYKSGNEDEKSAIRWINKYDKAPEEVSSSVFEDFLGQGEVLKRVLALAKQDTLLKLYQDYPIIQNTVAIESVTPIRSDLLGKVAYEHGGIILESLKELSLEGNLIVSQGYPFDYEQLELITIDYLVEKNELTIPKQFLNTASMAFVNDEIYILSDTGEDLYVAMTLSGYKVIDKAEFDSTYNIMTPDTGEITTDRLVFDAIKIALEDHYKEQVFIRYMKNDENEAYGIVSLSSDYQNYELVALKKLGDVFEVYAEGFETALELNRDYPDFNMNLVTRMNEDTNIQFLNNSTKSNLIAGLEEQGYMDDGEELVYCSYDGIRFISLELSSGEQYIYTIYRGSFLEDIYTIDVAIELFDTIDDMVLLQSTFVEGE